MPNPEAVRTQILDLIRQYHQAKFADKSFEPNKVTPVDFVQIFVYDARKTRFLCIMSKIC